MGAGEQVNPGAATGRSPEPAWTGGPAKWAAVVLLGALSIGGLLWSNLARVPHPYIGRAPGIRSSSAPGATPPPADTPAGAPPRVLRTINVNTAGPAELELLPGIGPALAQRIVDDRAAHGPFRSVNDLDRVKGIGPRTLERLRPLVRTD
jgi:competence ComEA-like helix-hairpin-helix protein